tara:strand:+ start:786 stop:2300 length:1515 start_codon:yes stop_codon:yes gene_type:complete
MEKSKLSTSLTSLSNNGYKIKKHQHKSSLIKECKEELTVKPFTSSDFGVKNETKFSLFLESPNSLYLPRFYAQEKFGPPDQNKMSEGSDINIKFNGSLRKEQEPIVELYLDAAEKKGGGIISLKCGGGKTVLALYLLSVLKKKTVVVVHKDFLMTQWRDRILQFLPDARIGKIQQNTIDVEDKDVVLAMVQSLSMKEYEPGVFDSFGLAIFDECHHLGAEVFSKALPKVASKYMLGLSATPNRKDGLRKVFEWYIGDLVYTSNADDSKDEEVEVNIIEYYDDTHDYCKPELTYMKKPCCPLMINNVCEHQHRTEQIYKKIKEVYDLGRKILILSDRRGHLDNILEWCNREIKGNVQGDVAGLYVGGMKPNDLRDSQEKDIILGTFSMASEGMDIPKLNTILLVSPKSDIVQSVGRIMREKPDQRTHHPLIIDYVDTHPNFSVFERQSKKRLVHYNKMKYNISTYKDDGSVEKHERKKRGRKSKKDKELEIEINFDVDECLIDDD